MEEADASGASVPDVSVKYPALSHALSSDSAQPSTSREDSASPSAQKKRKYTPNSRIRVSMTGHLFPGVLEVSQKGIHPVIRYPIPGGELCYAFEHVRTTKQGVVVYRCTACRKKRSTITIAVQNQCEFIGDPVELPHICTPLNNAQDKVTRMVYQSCRAIAKEPQLAEAKPNELWKSIAQFIDDNAPDDEAQRNEMLKHFYRSGYKSRRKTIARAAKRLHRAVEGKAVEEQVNQMENSIKKEPLS